MATYSAIIYNDSFLSLKCCTMIPPTGQILGSLYVLPVVIYNVSAWMNLRYCAMTPPTGNILLDPYVLPAKILPMKIVQKRS